MHCSHLNKTVDIPAALSAVITLIGSQLTLFFITVTRLLLEIPTLPDVTLKTVVKVTARCDTITLPSDNDNTHCKRVVSNTPETPNALNVEPPALDQRI